jgi:hypothetical protein
MTQTVVKGLTPGATYKAYEATRAGPFNHYFEQVPGAPKTSAAADTAGTLTLDLPDRQEYVIVGPTGIARRVMNSTTRGGMP